MKTALQIVYPAQCPCCGTGVVADGALCAQCWPQVEFITGAACDKCGVPLPGDNGQTEFHSCCDDCMTHPPPWHRAQAAIVYAGQTRQMLMAFKHGDRPDLAPALAGWLANRLTRISSDSIVVPVPLHPRRFLRRKYNQAELIAAPLARQLGLLYGPTALIRRRHTRMQRDHSAAQRHVNLHGAFDVPPRMINAVRRPVLLVDDVMASGATLTAATDALRRAGATLVEVAVLARAVKSL